MKNNAIGAIIVLFSVSGILGCSHHSDNTAVVTPATYVSGRVVKGVIANAKVAAYTVDANVAQLAEGRTDDKGDYQLRLPDGYQAPVYVVAATDADSRVTCDTLLTCNAADGTQVVLGARFAPTSEITLAAMLPQVLPETDNAVNLTVFSNMAATPLVKSLSEHVAVTGNDIRVANAKVTNFLIQNKMFDFDGRGDVVAVRPVDVTNQEEIAAELGAHYTSGIQIGFASAAIANLAQSSGQGDVAATIEKFAINYSGTLPISKGVDGNAASMEALVDAAVSEVDAYNLVATNVHVNEIQSGFLLAQNQIHESLPKPAPVSPPVGGGQIVIELPASLMPKLPNISTTDVASFLKGTGQAMLTPLRTLAHTGTEVTNAFTGIITTAAGNVLTSQINNDAHNLADVAKQFYPHMGAIIRAIVVMGEDKANVVSYDLATDAKNLLPDGLVVRGTVTRTKLYSNRFVLNDGYIEGLGSVKLDMTVSSSYSCYYCSSYEYVNFTASIQGANGDITMSSYNNTVYRSYDYTTGRRVPYSVTMRNADTVLNWKSGDTNVHLHGTNSLDLAWSSYDIRRLPTVNSFTVQGSYRRYDYTQDIRIPSLYLTYTNNANWKYQGYGAVDAMQRQADYFTLTLGLKAQVKTVPGDIYSPYRDVNLEIGVSRTPYGPYDPTTYYSTYDYRRQWLQIGVDNETYKFESDMTDSPRYALYTQSGAMVEMLMKNDGKTVASGAVTYRGKSIASISSSSAGPMVRFTDGTMQSF